MKPLQYGQILEVKSPGSFMKIYHRFYKHPSPTLNNIIVWERVIPKNKKKEEVEERWIVEKDFSDRLKYYIGEGFTETKIIEDNDKTNKKSSKKTK